MIKNLLVAMFALSMLTACDDWWESTSQSGSGAQQPSDVQVVDLTQPNTPSASAAESEPTSNTSSSKKTEPPAETTNTSNAKTEPEPEPREVAATENRSNDKCGVGNYAFVTTRDNKRHFTGTFKSGGKVQYQLKDGPTGKWSLKGDRMSIYGPFKMPGRKYTTLHMTVSRRAPDCRVLEARGKSPGGSDFAIRRM